ncbi:MAG: HAD-IIIA family hydrolase [Lachnospiraceae bacterium]|nr:HAD-IIIA family hydrolase [Lachnospiraceae bacterium]
MSFSYTAVIQAGGKGTRLAALTKDTIPKPMLPLNGRPMLQWQIESLKEYGVTDIIIITGHLGHKIREYFGDGSRFGVRITYREETIPLGSAGSLYYLKEDLGEKDFILIFGDVMFDLAWDRMLAFHRQKGALATLLVHPNAHPHDSDLIIMDENSRIRGMDSKHNVRDYWYENLVNAGLYILNGRILRDMTGPVRTDLEKDLLRPLMEQSVVYGYRTPEYVKDAGTVERFRTVCREQAAGIWNQKKLSNRQKCIFLDRDGTINRYDGLISREEQLELLPCAAEAIRRINESGCLAIVITNQPVVARGMCSIEDVKRIHKKMEVLLGREGAYLDDMAFCPHHPDKGYPEENPAYKISCDCRKPATGLIDDMVKKYNIDRAGSYFIGDSTVDIQTGKNAGLHTVLVQTGVAGGDCKYDAVPEMEAADLLEAVTRILGESSV